jgi:hypothetical protein
VPIVYDLVEPDVLVEYTRMLTFPQFSLDRWLPNRNIRDIEYRFNKAALQDQDVAPYRAFDAEAAIGKRQGISRVSGELPPISKKMRLGEESRLRLEMLRGGDRAPVINQLFDDAAMMTRAVQARIEQARGQALYTGTVVINENGVQATIDFGMAADHKPTAAASWATAGTDILTDLLTWRDKYVADTGEQPGVILTSTKVMGYLQRNVPFRELTVAGGATAPTIITQETIAAILRAHGLPPIVAYDTTVRVDGVATRVIPDDKVLFLPATGGAPLGSTFYGMTAEELELRQAGVQLGGEGGIVTVVTRTDDPVATWTKAAAIAVPIIANPELIIAADVVP